MAEQSLPSQPHWMQGLQLTDEQSRTVKRYRAMLGIRGFAFWRWAYRKQEFEVHGQLGIEAGYSLDDLASFKRSTAIRGLFHPDDLDRCIAIIRHHILHKTPIHFSFRLLKKNGGHLWVTTMANSIRDSKGHLDDIVGVAFDATQLQITQEALRTAELRLQRVMNASNDGIWEWNIKENTFDCSYRVIQHLGFQSFDDLTIDGEIPIKGWTRRIHSEDFPAFKHAVHVSTENRSPFDYSYRIADRDGVYRWVRTRAVTLYNADGQAEIISGTNIDITDIKKAQDRLASARDEAESANVSKSRFLSGMSQELRKPMNAILGYAQLFEFDRNLTDQQSDNLNEIRKAGEHLIQLIDDVLDLSKIESGNVNLNLESVVVAEVVRDCVTLSHPQANQYNVTITADLDGHEALCAKCDRVRLKQVLLNLISNGIKYNRPSGWININIFEHDDKELCISVEDNGFGISEAKQRELFQPFNRLGAEKTTIEGSGVGLVITKRLVEMMDGDISVYSQENVGSCFEIHLQRCGSNAGAKRLSLDTIIREDRHITLNIKKRKTVLYIENNTNNGRLMQKLFQHIRNIDLDVASEPLLGVYKARTEKPDVILMDVNVDSQEGSDLIEILNADANTKTIPKLAFADSNAGLDAEYYSSRGVMALLSRPIRIGQLLVSLKSVLQSEPEIGGEKL